MRNKFTAVKTAKKRTKSSNAWLKRQINDPFVKKAQDLGLRSRAAFKIMEIEDKFKIFKKGKLVLDLGAAPGGWSQFAVTKVGNGRVFALDILPMESIDGVRFLQQDFLKEDADTNILEFVNHNKINNKKFDIVMSDMAENTCGDSKTDHLRIIALLEEALEFSYKILDQNGVFIAKIFQGGAGGDLLKNLKSNFAIVKHFKPKSSRKQSAESYLIALGFKGSN